MHEVGLAQNLLEKALKEAGGAERLLAIRVALGEDSGVSEESLSFCFEMLSQKTPAEGAALKIRRTPGREIVLERLEILR